MKILRRIPIAFTLFLALALPSAAQADSGSCSSNGFGGYNCSNGVSYNSDGFGGLNGSDGSSYRSNGFGGYNYSSPTNYSSGYRSGC